MRAFNLIGGLTALALCGGALAADEAGPVVIELFTSQGCASCPPADEMLVELAKLPGVLPLALHVDYWDYIGWEDTFGSPRYTARQQAYALAAGERMVYTPQLIIGGTDRVIGVDPVAVMGFANAAAARDTGISLNVSRIDGLSITVQGQTAAPFAAPLTVQLVRYLPEAQVDIIRGENAGQSPVYVNIVTDWQVLGEWDGTEPLDVVVPAPGEEPAAIIVQERGPGRILAAANLR